MAGWMIAHNQIVAVAVIVWLAFWMLRWTLKR